MDWRQKERSAMRKPAGRKRTLTKAPPFQGGGGGGEGAPGLALKHQATQIPPLQGGPVCRPVA